MGRISTIFIILAVIVLGPYSLTSAFNYPGEINPRVIYTWEVADRSYVDADGFYYVLSRNPDPESPIRCVLFKVFFPHSRMVVQYAHYRAEDGSLLVAELIYERYLQGICEFKEIEPSAEERAEIEKWLTCLALSVAGQ